VIMVPPTATGASNVVVNRACTTAGAKVINERRATPRRADLLLITGGASGHRRGRPPRRRVAGLREGGLTAPMRQGAAFGPSRWGARVGELFGRLGFAEPGSGSEKVQASRGKPYSGTDENKEKND